MLFRSRAELERVIIASGFSAAVQAQDYVVLGTIDRRIWRRGLAGDAQLADIREHIADFKKYLKTDVMPMHWERSNQLLANLRMEPTRDGFPSRAAHSKR